MSTIIMPNRAKTSRGKRILQSRLPKHNEVDKAAVFINGSTASGTVKAALNDLALLKKPLSKVLSDPKKNQIQPFVEASSLENLSRINDTPLFVFGSSSKKRPHTLTFGRTYDYQLLDMLEFQLDTDTFLPIQHFTKSRKAPSHAGSKPMFAFIGDLFESDNDMKTFKSILLDTFRGAVLNQINLIGLDKVIVVTAAAHPIDETKKFVTFRHYTVAKKKSGTRVPRVVLEEVGPHMNLTFNRSTYASSEIRKAAMKTTRGAKLHLPKNVEMGQLGQRLGRVHMEKQDFNELALAKHKGLGKRKNPNAKRVAEPLPSGLNGLGEQQSTKKSKTLPIAYLSSVISE